MIGGDEGDVVFVVYVYGVLVVYGIVGMGDGFDVGLICDFYGIVLSEREEGV